MDLKRTCALIISMMMCWWEGASINLAGQAGLIEREGLDLPAECILGETCWVANYVDVDPADAALDFHCNPRTYNGHRLCHPRSGHHGAGSPGGGQCRRHRPQCA